METIDLGNGAKCIIYDSGSKLWHLDGKLHRTDGPAVEYADGTKRWCLNGKDYTEENFKKVMCVI